MTKGIKHKDIGPELTRAEFEVDDSHELEEGTSFPGSPTEKDRFYRTDLHKWYIYNGTTWKDLGVEIITKTVTIGDNILHANDSEKINAGITSYTQTKSTKLWGLTGTTLRIAYQFKATGTDHWGWSKIYKNNSPFGTERENGTGEYIRYEEDLAFGLDDLLQVFTKTRNSGGNEQAKVKEFRVLSSSAVVFQNVT